MNKKILAALTVLALVTLACALPSLGGRYTTGSDDGGSVVDNNLLFMDDFSDTGSGWDRYQDELVSTDYFNDAYRIQVFTPAYWAWAIPNQYFSGDVRVTVHGTMRGGPLDNAFGVICRHKDVENFYLFMISSDGYVGIGRRINGSDLELISGDSLVTSDAILQGQGATNAIQADCIGSTLTLTVNGTQVLTVTDTSLTSGDVGLAASTFSESGVDILFDNFTVMRP
jgi:hypothetical protein